MSILKRFEDEALEDDLEMNQSFADLSGERNSEEDEDLNSLADRLATLGIAVDDAAPEAIWKVLTPEERDAFLKTVKDPEAVTALSQQAEKGFENDTWWSYIPPEGEDEDEPPDLRLPVMIEVPRPLIPQKVDPTQHRPVLIYNLIAIWCVILVMPTSSLIYLLYQSSICTHQSYNNLTATHTRRRQRSSYRHSTAQLAKSASFLI